MTCNRTAAQELPQTLTAGPLTAQFYRGDLRYISVGDTEVVRRITFAVRNTKWGTPQPQLTNLVVDEHADGFSITYDAAVKEDDVDFSWTVTIRAIVSPHDVSLSVVAEGLANRAFSTNRVGFCVLHPITHLVGETCDLEHVAGHLTASRFPDLISPHQLFTDVQAMQYRVGGLTTTLRFYGEAFETEDQRNWSDTSFKTYSRPLSRPRPYSLNAGQSVRQAISLVVAKPPRPVRHLGHPAIPTLRLLKKVEAVTRDWTLRNARAPRQPCNQFPSSNAFSRRRASRVTLLAL